MAIRPSGGDGRDAKFLSAIVVPDAAPVVRVPVPGQDVAITGTKGRIAIEVDAQDDLGLASLSVGRVSDRHWRGRAEWVLDGLELSDGDVLVYRALARDRNRPRQRCDW